MNNLTKLFCDLISIGSQLGDRSVTDEHIGHHLRYVAFSQLPEDCDIDCDAVDDHIKNVRCAMNGADNDIDDIRTRLAQGHPISISRIVEFHGKLTVKLNDGTELPFDAKEVSHC